MKQISHVVDFCVIGGGMSGICAAIAAARHGATVVLMHDRPVLGGNASSEIRMHICGANGDNNRETGILEEILLENLYRNDPPNFSVWDSVLYEKVKFEENITLLLNCTCMEAEMDGGKIRSIRGWQLTTETFHTVKAKYFADCSGDSILAPLTCAQYRIGREASDEYNETIAPPKSDNKTMGMSLLLQMRETCRPQKFIPPEWANKYETDDDLPFRDHDKTTNYWWIELGGEHDSIHDTEMLRDELLKITYGIWDHMKNHGDHDVENFVLEWTGFLPGKRESRRYIGDYVLTQNDVESQGRFTDLVAYGGWSMDDHFPAGMNYKDGYPTIFHPAPSPYGIPYRVMYSKNIENLFFAGRNISATHTAMSSTRVMGTCSVIGQAVGIAASIAAENNLTPREVYEQKIKILQQKLMDDDCYLPFHKREISDLTKEASLSASASMQDLETLRNGHDRKINNESNSYKCKIGDYIEYSFNTPKTISMIRFIFDSNLNRNIRNMPSHFFLDENRYHLPETLVKAFRIDSLNENGEWQIVFDQHNNHQRFVKIHTDIFTKAIRFYPLETWGLDEVNIFAWDMQ